MTAPEYTPPPSGWRTFLIVWVTQSASLLGSALTLFALTVWLTVAVYPAEARRPWCGASLDCSTRSCGVWKTANGLKLRR